MTYQKLNIFFLAALLLLAALCFFLSWTYVLLLFPVAIYLGVLAWASANIRSNLFVKTLSSTPAKQSVCFTFDDGPSELYTQKIADLLHNEGISGTFFLIGNRAEQHPEIVSRLHSQGHVLGNHTYSHLNSWGFMSKEKVKREIELGNEALAAIIGKKSLLFRPPFGVTNPRIGAVLKKSNCHVIGWDLRTLDTQLSTEKVKKKIHRQLDASSILLFHDTLAHTPELVEYTIALCRERGIKIVSLQELLQIEAYEKTPHSPSAD